MIWDNSVTYLFIDVKKPQLIHNIFLSHNILPNFLANPINGIKSFFKLATVHSFSLLCSVPLYEYIFFIVLFIDIWAISRF